MHSPQTSIFKIYRKCLGYAWICKTTTKTNTIHMQPQQKAEGARTPLSFSLSLSLSLSSCCCETALGGVDCTEFFSYRLSYETASGGDDVHLDCLNIGSEQGPSCANRLKLKLNRVEMLTDFVFKRGLRFSNPPAQPCGVRICTPSLHRHQNLKSVSTR